MIVWRIAGDDIGDNGNGAAYFATRAEAIQAHRDHHEAVPDAFVSEPERIDIRNRRDLAWHLNEAMGYGCGPDDAPWRDPGHSFKFAREQMKRGATMTRPGLPNIFLADFGRAYHAPDGTVVELTDEDRSAKDWQHAE